MDLEFAIKVHEAGKPETHYRIIIKIEQSQRRYEGRKSGSLLMHIYIIPGIPRRFIILA